MKNKLKSMRDAEANNYYNDRDCTGWELRAFDTDNFKAGWDARDKIDNEALKIAVDSLKCAVDMIEKIDSEKRTVTEKSVLYHILGTFIKIRELMGEK